MSGSIAALRKFRNITFDRVIMDRYENALREGHPRDDGPHPQDGNGMLRRRVMHSWLVLSRSTNFGLAMTKAFPTIPLQARISMSPTPIRGPALRKI